MYRYRSVPAFSMHYPYVTLRQAGLQALPVAQASSLRTSILATAGRC